MTTFATPTVIPTKLFIAGAWHEASNGDSFDVFDPSSGDVIAAVADATVDDGRAAVDAAEAAGNPWAATAPRARAAILQRAYDLMMERSDEIAALIVRENGKAWADAQGEVAYAAEFFRWYAEETPRIGGQLQTAPNGDKRIMESISPSAPPYSSRRGTSPPPWQPARSHRRWRQAVRSCSSRPPKPR